MNKHEAELTLIACQNAFKKRFRGIFHICLKGGFDMKKYYIFIRRKTGLIFYTTVFADDCSSAVFKEYNPSHLQKMYGSGIMFASLSDSPKRSNRFSMSF